MPFPTPEDLPDPGIEPASLVSSSFVDGFFTTGATWEAPIDYIWIWVIISDKRTILVQCVYDKGSLVWGIRECYLHTFSENLKTF